MLYDSNRAYTITAEVVTKNVGQIAFASLRLKIRLGENKQMVLFLLLEFIVEYRRAEILVCRIGDAVVVLRRG